MPTTNAGTTLDPELERRHRRSDVERLLSNVFGASTVMFRLGMLFYNALEALDRKVEIMQEAVAALEKTLNEVEAEESVIVTGITDAGVAFADLAKTIEGLEAGGGTITSEEVAALNTQAQGVLTGLTSAAAALNAEIPAQPAPPVEPAKPTKALYTKDGAEPADASWTLSAFQVPAIPANPTTGAAEVAAQPLYEFSGDAAGTTEANGAGGEWTLYTGTVEAVPAAA